jgi:hypothetical protein
MLLQFDMKVFDGQGDEIWGIFRSFEGLFYFILKPNKGRHNSKLQSMADSDFS